MAEAGWDEVTHIRKRPMKAAEARSQRVISLISAPQHDATAYTIKLSPWLPYSSPGPQSSSEKRTRD